MKTLSRLLDREWLAEFLGTWMLIVFGVASVAQAVFAGNGKVDLLSIHLSWGLAVTMAVYTVGSISGAHLNPAVTLALVAFRGFSPVKALSYVTAQVIGAFMGALTVFAVYKEAFTHFDGGIRQVTGKLATAGIFATYPQSFLSTFPGGFLDQVVGTALLVLLIFALTDSKNSSAPSAKLTPVIVGAVVALIGMTFGYNAGYAINPARDLGPRLFTALYGWGNEVFTASNHWWWVPVVAPCVGALLGGGAHEVFLAKTKDIVETEETTGNIPSLSISAE